MWTQQNSITIALRRHKIFKLKPGQSLKLYKINANLLLLITLYFVLQAYKLWKIKTQRETKKEGINYRKNKGIKSRQKRKNRHIKQC